MTPLPAPDNSEPDNSDAGSPFASAVGDSVQVVLITALWTVFGFIDNSVSWRDNLIFLFVLCAVLTGVSFLSFYLIEVLTCRTPHSPFLRSMITSLSKTLFIGFIVTGAFTFDVIWQGFPKADWPLSAGFSFGMLTLSSIFLFPICYFRFRPRAGADDILATLTPNGAGQSPFLTFFIRKHEYVFAIFVGPDGLWAWRLPKDDNVISDKTAMPDPKYVSFVSNPDLLGDPVTVKRLAAMKGGFSLPRSGIVSIDVSRTANFVGDVDWRITIRMASGKSRTLTPVSPPKFITAPADAEAIGRRCSEILNAAAITAGSAETDSLSRRTNSPE